MVATQPLANASTLQLLRPSNIPSVMEPVGGEGRASACELEARVGIEGRPPSALLLRAQFQTDNTRSGGSWQDRPFSARAVHG